MERERPFFTIPVDYTLTLTFALHTLLLSHTFFHVLCLDGKEQGWQSRVGIEFEHFSFTTWVRSGWHI